MNRQLIITIMKSTGEKDEITITDAVTTHHNVLHGV